MLYPSLPRFHTARCVVLLPPSLGSSLDPLKSCQTLRRTPHSLLSSSKISYILEVDYVLTTDLPFDPPATTLAHSHPESSTEPSATAIDQVKKNKAIDLEKYEKDNKNICRHLLNYMSDPMFMAQKFFKDI
ncbi:ty1-copia retrotransposon protein [Cucumis melo var. makuwa]|uniref:Ty1-copia retrotransposon protein n=1 Tax=Cucumis melo var. makuwa TaxID=1194695 RepID=A0A5A7UVU9_CUCMM|nr:ty1-copia retrotransposon protein [Cucumis melo var. makuwa]TYK27464.1 ty1-copia retrotransposon protein [Cucumis melo var. makuwa]